MSSDQVLVFGHVNPDTDAVTSSLVYASFLRKSSTPAKAQLLGVLNPETLHVLANGPAGAISPPEALDIDKLQPGTKVALVDHNESSQSLSVLYDKSLKLQITAVIDHHKIGDLHTSEPLYCRIEPVGCTGTILHSLFVENSIEISAIEAHLMMSAILSDTLNFTSPTTTPKDKKAVAALAKLCNCTDTDAWSLSMFKAKSDVSQISAVDLVKLDYKVFDMPDGTSWGIGGVETVDVPAILGRASELSHALDKVKSDSPKPIAGIFLVVVDILQVKSTAILPATPGTELDVISKAYSTTVTHKNGVPLADLGNNVSRKKQLVPMLLASLSL